MQKKKNVAVQDIEMKKKKATSQIGTKSFFVVVSLLTLILFTCWVKTLSPPQAQQSQRMFPTMLLPWLVQGRL